MKSKTRTWLVLVIAEPFPLFYGHVSYDQQSYSGPCYMPGSRFYQGLDTPKNCQGAESKRDHLTQAGFSVTLTTEVR